MLITRSLVNLQMPHNEYLAAHRLTLSGDIKTLADVFFYVKKTHFAKAIRMTPERLNRLLLNPENIRMTDIYRIADLFELDYLQIVHLVHGQKLLRAKAATARKQRKV